MFNCYVSHRRHAILLSSEQVDSPPAVRDVQVVNHSNAVDEVHSLRRALGRKNEKIEFLKDHIEQLLDELHRKSK
jgi:hypothetical protein